jgi:alkyl sulfatase BDS1-like metallo-beta-lactamase superfamily hydrolase
MPIDILFDFAAVHVIGTEAAKADIHVDFAFPDLNETWTMWIKRGVLNARKGASSDPQLTVFVRAGGSAGE